MRLIIATSVALLLRDWRSLCTTRYRPVLPCPHAIPYVLTYSEAVPASAVYSGQLNCIASVKSRDQFENEGGNRKLKLRAERRTAVPSIPGCS